MKLLSWIQNKLNGYRNSHLDQSPSNVQPESEGKEEFNDWPQGLFAIGTLGNDKSVERQERSIDRQQSNPCPSTRDLTLGEIGGLQKELISVLRKQEKNDIDKELARFSEEPNLDEDGNNLHSPRKDCSLQSTYKRSLSFLLKKASFICRSGFPPVPASLRDPPPEPRIGKMFKAMLRKKIYPQHNSTQPVNNKRFLENSKQLAAKVSDDRENEHEDANPESKWVRTDSEYIVLEI